MASRHSCPVRYLWTDIPSGTSVQRISKAAGSSSTATNRIELPAKLQSISISRQLALKIETPCHLRVSFRQAGMVVAGRGGGSHKNAENAPLQEAATPVEPRPARSAIRPGMGWSWTCIRHGLERSSPPGQGRRLRPFEWEDLATHDDLDGRSKFGSRCRTPFPAR